MHFKQLHNILLYSVWGYSNSPLLIEKHKDKLFKWLLNYYRSSKATLNKLNNGAIDQKIRFLSCVNSFYLF